MRRELSRRWWLVAAAPLAGACLSAAALVAWTAWAEQVLAADPFSDDREDQRWP